MDRLDNLPLIASAIAIGIVIGTTLLARWLVYRFIPPLLDRQSPLWAEILKNRRVLTYLYLIVPGIMIAGLVVFIPGVTPKTADAIYTAAVIYSVIMVVAVITSGLLAYNDFYNQHYDFANQVPIKTVIQTSIVLVILLGILVIIAILLNVPLWALAGVVAIFAGIATFLFREPMLGFSASLQLSANHMLSIGDWLEMPKFGADGLVEDINITSTKVRNWDNSTVNVPTYSLIQNSFQNWSSMFAAESRRVKRPIFIDQLSIAVADEELVNAGLAKITELYEKLPAEKKENIGMLGTTPDELRSQEELTNLELFMSYATQVIAGHPLTRSNELNYVRQQDPTPQGLPVETFFFTSATDFVPFHAVQREIFSRLIAALEIFELRPYQIIGESS